MKAPADTRLGMAIELHKAGRLAEAEKLYRDVMQRNPRDANVLYLLGMIALATARYQRAADLLGRSVRLNAQFAPAHLNLGLALTALKRPRDALAEYDAAITCGPDLADAHYNRGVLLKDLGQHEAALASFDQALALRPEDPEALNNRGLILDSLKRHPEALQSFDQALALRPRFPEALANRANTLNWLHRPDEALAGFDKAIALSPNFAEPWCNRGDTLHEQGRFADALASFDKAISLQPHLAEAHYGRSLSLLMLGRYAEGFRAHEWRKQRVGAERPRPFAQPDWLGKPDLAGRTLLIHPELFLGDMIQFCRYALVATARGAKVTLMAPRPLVALLRTLGPNITVIDADAPPSPFNDHCPLMSLPLAFGTTLQTVPVPTPYLHADPGLTNAWRRIIGSDGLKIGICWQGSASRSELDRAFPLAAFAPLLRLSGVRLISLQSGFGIEQITGLPAVEHFEDTSDAGQRPFTQSAAMLANLDLIITTDTSIAHLAAAMGRPTWIVLRHVPDWRWGPAGNTTPWYPTARLFRQTTKGNWSGVFDHILQAVAAIAKTGP